LKPKGAGLSAYLATNAGSSWNAIWLSRVLNF
jgi:hypothetical protein